jgi:hypothetical protein
LFARRLIPFILFLAALACVFVAALLLRSLGSRYRVGRLLAATPEVAIDEAVSLASRSRPTYVRVTGRISSDEEFPDENDRPLVFRRKRLQVALATTRLGARRESDWRTVADEREAVPFGVETRSAFIAVDDAAIDYGLVAIPRESTGRLSDLPADVASDAESSLPPDTAARLLIEQLSAVEHATACGVPTMRDGVPVLTSGLGRPLIITTLDAPAAMRLLAAGARRRVLASAGLLMAAAALGVLTVTSVAAGL